MKSQASDDFWKLFAQLPNEVKRQAHQAFKQFQDDPFYPGLNFEEGWTNRIASGQHG